MFMSKKAQRKAMQSFIENLPNLAKMLNVQVLDKEKLEIQIIQEDCEIKFFPSRALKAFVVLRKYPGDISIEDVRFTNKVFECMIDHIRAFIEQRSPKTREIIKAFKMKRRANKLRRTAKGKTDQNS